MNQREVTILLSVILLSCFFVPLVEWTGYEMNGLNLILSIHTPRTICIILAIPFSAILILWEAFSNRRLILGRTKRIIPFVTILLLCYIGYSRDPENFSLQSIDVGSWITVIVSLAMAGLRPVSRMHNQERSIEKHFDLR